ncbi:response regulator [Geomonas sp.]|uniref:response regulator n=1 Tax=Geomonas sp. TaxID=2651584 RepID=UPI002B46C43F|nr:response regulator [Geomonas sp.]HJV36547.1 response regulator [Geomonas sp.]
MDAKSKPQLRVRAASKDETGKQFKGAAGKKFHPDGSGRNEVAAMVKLKRILLVEDNANDAELTMEALAEHHLANGVDLVRDGAEALDYLYRREKFAGVEEANPAVILLDLKLPKVDGLEVLRTIKADDRLKFIPVVVLTSSREERDVIESYRLGVNAYVVKPVDFSEFINAVKELGAFWAIINEPPPSAWLQRSDK